MINPSPQHALRNTRRCMINCFIWVLDKVVFSHTGKINDNILFESFDAYFFKNQVLYLFCVYILFISLICSLVNFLFLWQPFQENASSYSSDSYSRYTSNPVNRHDDSKLREKFGSLAVAAKGERSIGHDPYRFTRSTANPVNTANIDKSKLSDLSARYR